MALVERFRPGHDRGSSHGFSRITRSTYGDPMWVRLIQVAHREEWPRLETDAGVSLRDPVPGLFFGPPDGPFESWAASVAGEHADVERVDAAEARRRFPQFRLENVAGVLVDRTAALVAASATVAALARRCVVEGVHVLDRTRVLDVDWSARPFILRTDRGELRAERLAIAAGPWTSALVPALASALTVRRQSIGFFRLGGGAATAPGPFPVWVWLGEGENGIRYGLPEFGRPGIKIGLHEVAGASQDPDEIAGPDEATLGRLEAFAHDQFTAPVEARLHAETCFYTSTRNEDFILDQLPGVPGAVVVSACSGHGFKFGPLTGRLAAELLMDGRTSVEPFERDRARFAFPAT